GRCLLVIRNLTRCSSFEMDSIIAFKGVGTNLAAEVTEKRDHYRTRGQFLRAIDGAWVYDELLASRARNRQWKYGSGVLVGTMRLKAGALLRIHLVDPHIGVWFMPPNHQYTNQRFAC